MSETQSLNLCYGTDVSGTGDVSIFGYIYAQLIRNLGLYVGSSLRLGPFVVCIPPKARNDLRLDVAVWVAYSILHTVYISSMP